MIINDFDRNDQLYVKWNNCIYVHCNPIFLSFVRRVIFNITLPHHFVGSDFLLFDLGVTL